MKYRVTLERSAVEYLTLEVEAGDEEAASSAALEMAITACGDDRTGVIDNHFSEDDESSWDISDTQEVEPEFDAIMPDGSRFDWDDRLATVGAKKVPR